MNAMDAVPAVIGMAVVAGGVGGLLAAVAWAVTHVLTKLRDMNAQGKD